MENYPVNVEEKPGVGRCLVASRDIEPGELLLVDHSATIGPKEVPTTLETCHEYEELFPNPDDWDLALKLSAVAPVRLARAMERDSELREQVEQLMEHKAERAGIEDHMERTRRVLELVENAWKSPEFTSLVEKAIGVLHVNAIDNGKRTGRVLFPRFSLLSHSCVNNSRHVMVPDASANKMEIR